MLLTSKNLRDIKYNTKRVQLEKADAEINVALIPVDLMNEAKNATDEDQESIGLKIILSAIVDNDGKPVFESFDEFELLPLAVRNEILDAVHEYNGLKENTEKN